MRATRFRWLVVALIFFITVINYIDRSAIAYAIGAIARDLGFGHHDEALLNGFILAAFSLGYMFTTFLGGILADRHGARVTLFWAALLWSLAIGMTGFAAGFAMLVVARVLLGVAEGPNFPAMNRAVADWLSSRERAIALGNALVAVPLALAIGAPIVTQLILHLSWRGMFIVLMLASLLWLPLWWWLFRDFPEHSRHVNAAELAHIRDGAAPELDHAASARHAARRKTRGLWKFLLRNPTLLANDWAFFVFGYFLFFFMTWLPSYLQHAYGLKLGAVGWFSVLPWLTAALMLWGTGYLSDWLLRRTGSLRVARSHVIWVTQLLAGLCILPVIFVHDLGVALVFITLAVGLGMSSNACFYAVNVDVARARSGTALGVMDTFFALAGFIAPVLTGWLVGLTGHYQAAFALLALLALSSVLAVLLFHHPDQSAKLEDSTDARAAP
ncbi:major facilitator superfamily MFS_1 [mine drainage metagenome]|uniref:Major facilitator superfamily MFS_1 n=1 Tax=mine drainage metagenome TaxID=410659 RepID=T0ZN01_9ZZZZ